MIIDAQFIFTVAKLAIEFGEAVIVPIFEICHGDKTPQVRQKAIAKTKQLFYIHDKPV